MLQPKLYRVSQFLPLCSLKQLISDIDALSPYRLGDRSRATADDGAIFNKSIGLEHLSEGFAKFVDACIGVLTEKQTCGCQQPHSHSLFVNIMLPGESLPFHRDVPEFWGLGHHNAPHWLLHLMSTSSLFDSFQLPLTTCVYWPLAPQGGELILQLDPDAEELIQPLANNAVIFDAERIAHRVARIPGNTPGSDSKHDPAAILSRRIEAWELTTAAGSFSVPLEALRISVVYKASCYCGIERCRNNTLPLTLESVLSTLACNLADQGKANGLTDPDSLMRAIFSSFVAG